MAEPAILAIDQGTTNTKALLVGSDGAVLARAAMPTGVAYPRPGWVEQNPRDLWHCTCEAIAACLAQAPGLVPVAIGIANQRETALLWDRATGEPAGPAVVWQCRRTASFCDQLKADGAEPLLRARTGLQVDPTFSASKIRWLIDATPNGAARAAAGELAAGTVDAWLLWNLTGGAVHATDLTNASRTQLLDLTGLDWDDQVLALFGISRAALPALRPSSGILGETVARELSGGIEVRGGIPIASMIGDSHASLFGLGGFRPGSVKATYGTGTSLMTPTPAVLASSHGLSSTVAWSRGPQRRSSRRTASPPHTLRAGERPATVYALEGNITTTGGAVQWAGELLGLADPGAAVEALARTVPDAGGVIFVPALVGLGAPHWAPSARGLVTGLSLGTGRAHIARATLDAIAFQVRDVFDAMQADAGTPLSTLLADGGASRNDLLMQIQADTIGCPVERSRSSDVSALGAALLAGLAIGLWKDEGALEALIPARDRFEPQIADAEREARYAGWRGALARALLAP